MQQEILEAKPDADLRVYAVFFEMVEGDLGAKSRVDPRELLDDARVTVFWDDDRVAGRWFDENVTKLGARQGISDRIEWDTFVLYGPDAEWSEEPPGRVSWGRPIIQEKDRLAQDLEGVLGGAVSP